MKDKVTARVGELIFNIMLSALINYIRNNYKKVLVCLTSVEGLRTSAERPSFRRKTLESENSCNYHDDFVVNFAKTARFPSRTLVGIFFPFSSYMIGFASGFALHTLRRMVVLPAFALPMMRIRN